MAVARGVSELAKALGRNPGQVSHLRRRPWWPSEVAGGGWDVEACAAAIASNVVPKAPRTAPEAAADPAAPAPKPEEPRAPIQPAPANRAATVGELELARQLGEATEPLELTRLAARLAAVRYAAEVSGASRSVKSPDDLKRALQEWRQAEADDLELAQERGQLIPRDAAKAVIGAIARRLVLACERLEARLVAQVELWLADEAFGELGAEGRKAAVRAWSRQQTRQARLAETDDAARAEVERLVAAELEGRAA